jgi:hypothetical protein
MPTGTQPQVLPVQLLMCFGMLGPKCLQSIESHPEAGMILRGSVRRRLLHRFPYALLYKIKPSGIRILAVMSLKRRPTYWVGRE